MLDSVFTGNFLGHKSDIADGSLRGYEFRSLANIVGDYYVAPRFLDAVTVRASTWSSGFKVALDLYTVQICTRAQQGFLHQRKH